VRQDDAVVLGQGGVFGGGVLAAAVGVEDDAGRGVAGGQGIGEGVGGQFGAQVIGHGVAGDPAGGNVDDGGQVEPALAGGDVDDVATPAGVQPAGVGGEVTADQAGPGRCRGVGDGGALPPSGGLALQAPGSHELGDALAAVPVTAAGQFSVHPRRPVPATEYDSAPAMSPAIPSVYM
jgi:hypothetical protein